MRMLSSSCTGLRSHLHKKYDDSLQPKLSKIFFEKFLQTFAIYAEQYLHSKMSLKFL